MKKIISILLTLVLMMSLIGCDNHENTPSGQQEQSSQQEFPEIEVTNANLVNFGSHSLDAGKTVFGVDYREREITYNDEPRTLYEFEFGEGCRAEVYARETLEDKLVYQYSIRSNDAGEITNSNVTLFGNIKLEEVTAEMLEAYKDYFFENSECKYKAKDDGNGNDISLIYSSRGTVQVNWIGPSSDGKLQRIYFIDNELNSQTDQKKEVIKFSDTTDRETYPDLLSLLGAKAKYIQEIFGEADENTYKKEIGRGTLKYYTKHAKLIIDFDMEMAVNIYYSSDNSKDNLKITDKIRFNDIRRSIEKNIPEGCGAGGGYSDEIGFFRKMSESENNKYSLLFVWGKDFYNAEETYDARPLYVELTKYDR